jgi:hypothetical protein
MRAGNLSSGAGKLNLALKTLLLRWEDTKSRWNDPVGRAFENNQLAPLESQVLTTLREIQRLNGTLARADHDCS